MEKVEKTVWRVHFKWKDFNGDEQTSFKEFSSYETAKLYLNEIETRTKKLKQEYGDRLYHPFYGFKIRKAKLYGRERN